MSYTVKILRSSSDIQAFLPAWEQFLAARTRGHALFNDPHTVLATTRSSSSVSPFVVVVERAGVIRAIAPFLTYSNRFRLQFSVFQLASFAVRTMMLPGNSVVLAADEPDDGGIDKILEVLATHVDTFDLLFLNGILPSEDLWRHLQSSQFVCSRFRLVPAASGPDVAFRIALPASFDEYFQSLGSSTRGTLKRRTRNLLEDAGGRMCCASHSADVELLLKRVDEIYSDTWQAKTYGHRIRCTADEINRLRHMAQRGWLRSYVLLRGETPVAFQLGFQYGDVFHAMDFGFAQAAADSGPGTVLMHLMIRDLFDRDKPQVLDLGHGDAPQKHTFRGVPHSVLNVYVVPRGRRLWFIFIQPVLTRIEGSIRSVLIRLRIDNLVRRILKRRKR